MKQAVYIVDAFTSTRFSGNPAAVVPVIGPAPEEWMQSVAAEMNLSETAFVDVSSEEGPKGLRWFTPTSEVDLCGHATLATSHVLGGSQRYATRSGELRTKATSDGWIEMDFPTDPLVQIDQDWTRILPGTEVLSSWRGRFADMAVLASEADVRAASPNLDLVAQLPGYGAMITAPADDSSTDFVSRCFFPKEGIPEDPVTGSAHCALAPWWQQHLQKNVLYAEQVSARSGRLVIRPDGDRVHIAGQAVTVLVGELQD